jgi:hypothetical protein
MAQKLKAARDFNDKEFEQALEAVLKQDRKLLEMLARY